jgi:hypothetical protein
MPTHVVTATPASQATNPTGVMVSAPPRCNFAGFCNYCGQQGCRSRDCVSIYLDTWWAPCEICDGVGGDGLGSSCLCTYGVVQVGPGRQGAIQPR